MSTILISKRTSRAVGPMTYRRRFKEKLFVVRPELFMNKIKALTCILSGVGPKRIYENTESRVRKQARN